MSLDAVQALAELAKQDGDVTNDQREAAIALARSGALLNHVELGAIFGLTYSGFYKNAKRGLYDVFKVNPPLGQRCYSGVLVTRYLQGEPLYVPTFGRRKRA